MNESAYRTFWERLAARTQPSGALATVEDPKTTVRLMTFALWAAAVISGSGGVFMLAAGEPAAAAAYWVLSAIYLVSWLWYAGTGSTRGAMLLAVLGSAVVVTLVQVSLGGYAQSGGQLMWYIGLAAVSALLLGRRWTIGLAVVFVTVAIITGLLESSLATGRPAPDPALSTALFVLVLVGSLVTLSYVFIAVLDRLAQERERAESLLLNVLPGEVAAELKETGSTTARRYESVSVLFADIVGFTPLSASMEPEEMVNQLNDVFTYFDTLAEKYGAEKIRTIGDNYMVAAGVPTPRDDHAETLSAMALDMIDYSERGPLSFRLGINSGPAVAGVIGTRKFQYDLWGDTINTASRMESHGEPGKIQITEATHNLIRDHFHTTRRGPVEVKGLGTLNTWYLEHTPQPATTS